MDSKDKIGYYNECKILEIFLSCLVSAITMRINHNMHPISKKLFMVRNILISN